MKKIFIFTISVFVLVSGCIKDDFVMDLQDPELRIVNVPDSIAINTDFIFEAMYLNNVGLEENVDIVWSSDNESIINITANGNATALALGSATIFAEYDDGESVLRDSVTVGVGEMTVMVTESFSGTINTTSSYLLEGDFTITEDGTGVILEIASNYKASTALPGLYVYLSNNPNTSANALEIAAVQTFSGAHSYTIPNTSIYDYNYVLYYCKPFGVKVGHGEIIQ